MLPNIRSVCSNVHDCITHQNLDKSHNCEGMSSLRRWGGGKKKFVLIIYITIVYCAITSPVTDGKTTIKYSGQDILLSLKLYSSAQYLLSRLEKDVLRYQSKPNRG